MKARGRAAPLASGAVPALMAAAVLALGVPVVRLAASYPDTAPGGGAPWQVALQAAEILRCLKRYIARETYPHLIALATTAASHPAPRPLTLTPRRETLDK